MPFTLRSATPVDTGPIAELFFASYRLLTFLPMLHTIEEFRRFVADVLMRDCLVTVAEEGSGTCACLARVGEEVRELCSLGGRLGGGAGTLLIEASKSSGVGALVLWCFHANALAWQFYERRGFPVVRF